MIIEGTMIEMTEIKMMAKIEIIKRIREKHNMLKKLIKVNSKKINLNNLILLLIKKKTKKIKTKSKISLRNKKRKQKNLFKLKTKRWHLN
jgi:transcription-repair coupling factor (superfamily II helicase)